MQDIPAGKQDGPTICPKKIHLGLPWGAAGAMEERFRAPDLDRPGRQLHQQGLCEARLGESPQLGAPGPGSESTCRHCMQAPGKQRRHWQNGAGQAKNKVREGWRTLASG